MKHWQAALAGICVALSARAATYEVIDVARYDEHDYSRINRGGTVSGAIETDGGLRPFVYRDGTLQIIDMPVDDGFCYAINDRGDLAGSYYADHYSQFHGFYRTGERVRDIPGRFSRALGINNARQITGDSYDQDSHRHAYIYSDGVLTLLDRLGGKESFGMAINELGHVAGYYTPDKTSYRAFVYDGTQMRDLGTLPGGTRSWASSLNDADVIVGHSNGPAGYYHAVRFEAGGVTDLGTLGGDYSWALDINERGAVVGWSTVTPGGEAEGAELYTEAFLHRDGRMVNLNDRLDPVTGEGWVLHQATGINDSGRIVGWGEHFGKKRVFLLKPMK